MAPRARWSILGEPPDDFGRGQTHAGLEQPGSAASERPSEVSRPVRACTKASTC
jgi:hypothetical protein